MSEPDYAHNRWVKAARLAAAARADHLRMIHGLTGDQRAAILTRAEVPSASPESWALAHEILVFPDGLPTLGLGQAHSGLEPGWLLADVRAVVGDAGVRPASVDQDLLEGMPVLRVTVDVWDEYRAASEALRLAGYRAVDSADAGGKPSALVDGLTPVVSARFYLARAGRALDALGDALVPLSIPVAVRRAVLLDTAAEVLDAEDPTQALLGAVGALG